MVKIDHYYSKFLSWADEFENSSLENKKMIAGTLINKISVGRGYNVDIELDMNFNQFCGV